MPILIPLAVILGLFAIWLAFVLIDEIARAFAEMFESLGKLLISIAEFTLSGGILVVIVILVSLSIWAVWMFISKPTERFLKRRVGELEAYREKVILHNELKRKLTADQQKAKAKAFTAAARLHEKLKIDEMDARITQILEDIRLDAEIRIMELRMDDEIQATVNQYEAAADLVSNAADLSSAERLELIGNIRKELEVSGLDVNSKDCRPEDSRPEPTQRVKRESFTDLDFIDV